MSSVWILVNIYQNDLAYVHVGDPVTIENESYPGVLQGKIEYISPALDPNTRTLQARIESPNPGERLKKEMYVTAEVQAGMIPNALFVPDSAVLRDEQNMPYVYLQTGRTSLPGAMSRSAKAGRENATPHRIEARTTASSATAVFSCNSKIRFNVEGTGPGMIHHIVQFALRQRFLVLMAGRSHGSRSERFRFSACRWTLIPTFLPRWSNSSRNGPATRRKKSNAWSRCPSSWK